MSEFLIAILAGLGGMFGWGLADFFAKKTIDKIGDVASLAWGHVFGTIALVFMALYQFLFVPTKSVIPADFRTWFLLILFGVGQAFVYLFLYKGFGKGQVAVLSPVFASFSGIAAILSISVFGEVLSSQLIIGLITIFAGILLINADVRALQLKHFNFAHIPGFRDIIIATILAGFWTVFWGKFLGSKDWLMYTFIMYAFMTFTILVISKIQKVNLFIVKTSIWKFLIFIGLFETGAYLSISLGYSFTPSISIIALLSGAFSLPTIILAYIFLKERLTRIQAIGSIVIILGIAIISLV